MTYFTWELQPDPSWVEQLEQAGGGCPNDRVPYLKLVWMPGELWEPVCRWVIYECIPPARLLANPRSVDRGLALLAEYRGPSPSSRRRPAYFGKNDSGVPQLKRGFEGRVCWASNALVTQQQWELFRATGHHAQLYWIIQGRNGGHKLRFNPFERQILKTAGKWADLPPPGELPYAIFDRRVARQLIGERELKELFESVAGTTRDLEGRTDRDHYGERIAREKLMRAELLRWLDRQIHAVLEENVRALPQPSQMPAGRGATDEEYEAATEDFIAATTTAEV